MPSLQDSWFSSSRYTDAAALPAHHPPRSTIRLTRQSRLCIRKPMQVHMHYNHRHLCQTHETRDDSVPSWTMRTGTALHTTRTKVMWPLHCKSMNSALIHSSCHLKWKVNLNRHLHIKLAAQIETTKITLWAQSLKIHNLTTDKLPR